MRRRHPTLQDDWSPDVCSSDLRCLTALEPGISGCGEYTVKSDEFFLRGHFPGGPLMPGVLIVDAVSQLMGVAARTDTQISPVQTLHLTAPRGLRILAPPVPAHGQAVEPDTYGRLLQLT